MNSLLLLFFDSQISGEKGFQFFLDFIFRGKIIDLVENPYRSIDL